MSANQATTHYQVLGVPEHASLHDIEAAYHAGLAEIRAGLSSGTPLPGSFLDELRQAYRILGDSDQRDAYDRERGAAAQAPAASAAEVVGEEESAPLRFEFTGSGGEYFRIWIVNLILTVLTLGIYSAWAKVRREQYFHRNTLLAGSGFDYHGNPRAILKGRVVAWGLFMLLSITQKFSPTMYLVLVLCSIPIIPWFLMRSLKFRAANSSYRGLRFHHRGTYGGAFMAFVGHGLLLVPTLGLWLPMWVRANKRFQIGKLSFGGTDFNCEPRAGGFYRLYVVAGLAMLVPMIAVGVLVAMGVPGKGQAASAAAILMTMAIPVFFLVALALFVRPFVQVRLTNLVWNATRLGDHRFFSSQTFRSFWRIHAGNLALILLTLGLYWPWAKVREAAYRAQHFALAANDLDAFVGDARHEASAVGEEIADAFDLDFSL
jgi:uncharacterized membrane protein YjgN (DUF898 family)